MAIKQDTSSRHTVTLDRGLKLFDVTMIGVGAMIGAGIFGLTGLAAGEAGPVGLLLAFFLNGVVTSLTGLTYAELGAAIPEAGGGYLWVREGMSRFWGFFAGWISWFSHSVACSLYAVIFGTFFIELLHLAGIDHILFYPLDDTIIFGGLTAVKLAEKTISVLVILLFLYINLRGASETGAVGNIITIFKIIVLAALVVFGFMAMANMPNWADNFLNDPSPLPQGLTGVFLAMGLTFVAFEGYEIIAQSGEELIEPEKNMPKAIFYSILITVTVYLFVAFVAIGALVQDTGVPNWQFLGANAEVAMIRTAQEIMPYGALAMILGGLASTTSALNATVYSSSRVSFAMGRGGDLPGMFGLIHQKRRTPHIAIYISGILIIAVAVALPVGDVAGGASLTFLILFLLTNLSLVRLRKSHPDLHRAFKVPFVPWLPYITIAIQAFLAFHLFGLSPIAWVATILWTIFGIWVYNRLGGAEEAAAEADTILLEETIAQKGYSVLMPVANAPEARQMTRIAMMFAGPQQGEIFALHVIRVPQTMELGMGRAFLKEGRPVLEEAVEIGQEHNIPIRTQLRLSRDFAKSIAAAANERGADLLVLNWPGFTGTEGSSYGQIIDQLSANPPCDLAVVKIVRGAVHPKRILIPVKGGPNARRAVDLAIDQARFVEAEGHPSPEIVVLTLVRESEDVETVRATLTEELAIADMGIEVRVIRSTSSDIAGEILENAEGFDQIMIGASEEGLLEEALFGSIPQRVAEGAQVNVIMVKRHNPIKHGVMSRWFNIGKRSNGKKNGTK